MLIIPSVAAIFSGPLGIRGEAATAPLVGLVFGLKSECACGVIRSACLLSFHVPYGRLSCVEKLRDGRGDTPLVGVGGPGVCFCSVPKEPVEGAFRASYPRLARCMYFRQRWCLLILLMK